MEADIIHATIKKHKKSTNALTEVTRDRIIPIRSTPRKKKLESTVNQGYFAQKVIFFWIFFNNSSYIELFAFIICIHNLSALIYSSPRLISPPRDRTILGLLSGWAY